MQAAAQLQAARLRCLHAALTCPCALVATTAAAVVATPLPAPVAAGALLATLGLPCPPVLMRDAPVDAHAASPWNVLWPQGRCNAHHTPYALRCAWQDAGDLQGASCEASCGASHETMDGAQAARGAWSCDGDVAPLDTLVRPLCNGSLVFAACLHWIHL